MGGPDQGFDQEAFERVFLGEPETSQTEVPSEDSGQSQQDADRAEAVVEASDPSPRILEPNKENGHDAVDQEADMMQVGAELDHIVGGNSKSSSEASELDVGGLISNLQV